MDDEQKRQPTTVQMQAPPDWAISLSEKVSQVFSVVNVVNDRLDTIETNQDLQGATVRDLQQRMTLMETRQATNSERVRGASEVDLKHDAAIASLHEKVDAIAAKPDTTALVIAEIKAASGTPRGQKVIAALFGLLMLAISAIGVKLQAAVTKLEEKPAPPVYVLPAAADAGVH